MHSAAKDVRVPMGDSAPPVILIQKGQSDDDRLI